MTCRFRLISLFLFVVLVQSCSQSDIDRDLYRRIVEFEESEIVIPEDLLEIKDGCLSEFMIEDKMHLVLYLDSLSITIVR